MTWWRNEPKKMILRFKHHTLSCEARRQHLIRGRSPDLQVNAIRQPSHSVIEQWLSTPARSLLTVARPCGIFTRFPFHSPVEGEHLRNNKYVSWRDVSSQSQTQQPLVRELNERLVARVEFWPALRYYARECAIRSNRVTPAFGSTSCSLDA
jgi:hypothetical protein